MANTPNLKVYRANGEYVAAFKYAEDAARIIDSPGDTIRSGHNAKHAVWIEGVDGEAAESFDAVAALVNSRIDARRAALAAKIGAALT